MAKVAEKADPELWARVKEEITSSEKGGHAGQWSARKAQLAVQEYKRRGGAYRGRKSADNHLLEWQGEDWGTKSGHDSLETGERYLPKAAREALTPQEYRRTTAKKRADLRAGKQFSAQPRGVAEKTAKFRRHDGSTKADLLAEARRRKLAGRSRMSKGELEAALGR